MKKILIGVLVLAVLAGGGFWFWKAKAQPTTRFTFAEVRRGRLEATVGSTGTLQPREIVDVGAQVNGRIISIGPDSNTQSGIVDWGSEVHGPKLDKDNKVVEPGTLLARIDPDLFEAQVASTKAAVASAEAVVKSTQAAVEAAESDRKQKEAIKAQATNDWNRAKRLIQTEGVSQAEYDQLQAAFGVAEANLKSSTANIDVARANLGKAQADVLTARANLKTAETNLAYTKITAPVNGVVIDRRVNVGQTVVASLSAPSLFLIAKDLRKTEVWATVNEVDVGKIKPGAPVKFTVDAYPGRVYHGRVVPQGKLPFRLNASMIQNVVTYPVVVSVDDKENANGDLRPYMTANLTFLVDEKDNALLVPNAALRWQPAQDQIAPDVRDAYARIRGKKRSVTDPEALNRGIVWVKGDDGYVRFLQVRTGLSDSVNTEIVEVLNGGRLPEHTQVITGEIRGGGAAEKEANPFVAQPFGPKKKD
jgi:HlyD family secretion protein